MRRSFEVKILRGVEQPGHPSPDDTLLPLGLFLLATDCNPPVEYILDCDSSSSLVEFILAQRKRNDAGDCRVKSSQVTCEF
jgi:hypothetical protein